jgi:chorismate synthase
MSSGEVLRVRAAMKPISTDPAGAADHRHRDRRAGARPPPAQRRLRRPAAGVVAEAMVALVLADVALEKFGGDSVDETRRNCEAYLKGLAVR